MNLLTPSGFKSYDELKARLDIVMGSNNNDKNDNMSQSPQPTLQEASKSDEIDVDEYWGWEVR